MFTQCIERGLHKLVSNENSAVSIQQEKAMSLK